MSDRRQMLASFVATLCDPGASASAKTEAQNAISALELALQEAEASEAALKGHLVEADTTIGRLSIDAQFNRSTIAGWKSIAETARQANRDLRAHCDTLIDSYNSELEDAKDAQDYIRRLHTRNVDLRADNAALADSYNSKRRTLDALQQAHASEIDTLEAELAMSQATICTLVTKG